ncbi:MAG: hypothetical protein ABIH76_07055, partial [Candidatus Bathyarchaeota archaeon]
LKLLGPTAVTEALERNPDFATLRTLLRNPRVGDKILYRVGDHDVYFIPVYTAGAGGVVTELGAVAVVGAAFTGDYAVGLGGVGTSGAGTTTGSGTEKAQDAFRSYLAAVAGVELPPDEPEKTKDERKQDIIAFFEENDLSVVEPIAINPDISYSEGTAEYVSTDQLDNAEALIEAFIGDWGVGADKVLMWTEGAELSFGFLINVGGITELHYIVISLK